MPAVKTIRLSKAAKDLNVGLHRIVEFLATKDVEIASSPNSKIPSEVYELLENEFGKFKKEKAEAEEITSSKHIKENVVHEAGALGTSKKKVEQGPEFDESLERNLQEIKFGPGVTSPPISKPDEPKEEEIKAKKESQKPKVVGKIDVSKPKKTVAKKEEEKTEVTKNEKIIEPEVEPEKEKDP